MQTFRQYDSGVIINLTILDDNIPVNISTATNVWYYWRKPDGSFTQTLATVVNDGGQWKLQYVTTEGLFNLIGVWQVEGHLTLGGFTGTTEAISFTVSPVFNNQAPSSSSSSSE